MKGVRLKTFGAALLGALALLFAGCGQQTTGGTGGQEPPKPIQASFNVASGATLSNVTTVSVSYNEDAQVQEVALYVDDKLVGKQTITPSGLRPQALSASFVLNTLACDEAYLNNQLQTGCSPSDNTPVFTNGSHTLKAVLKNAVETKTLTLPVVFNNADRVLLTLSGNNAPDANNYVWYGGADLTVTAVPVSYSGRPVSKVRLFSETDSIPGTTISDSPHAIDFGAGVTAFWWGERSNPVEQSVSGGSATFTILKSLNDGNVEGGIWLAAQIRYADGTLSGTSGAYYALDFVAPNYNDLMMKLNGVYADTVRNITTLLPVNTNGWLNGNSPLYADVSDGGVGGVTYQIQVLQGATVKATLNPMDTLSSVPEAGVGTYKLQVVNIADALGNTAPNPAALPAVGGYGLDKTAPSLNTTFAANGKVLNGTLGLGSTIQGNLTEAGGSGVTAGVGGQAPTSSSVGAAGWLIKVTTGGCTYTLTAAGGSSNLPVNGSYMLDMTGTSAPAPAGCPTYPTISATGGDGDYTVTIQAVDQARNVSAPVTVSFYWLTTKPTVTFTTALPGTINMGGSSFVLANGAVQVNSPKPLKTAIMYSTGTGFVPAGDPPAVQYVATPPKNINNNPFVGSPFNLDGSVIAGLNYQDITAGAASGLSFQLQFNTFGSLPLNSNTRTYDITVAAVPEAYDNMGNLDVSNLENQTSQTVTVKAP